MIKKYLFILLCISSLVYAREQVKIVGSSTVYPFASAVAEELGSIGKYKTPVVESTGTGGGMKLFCAGNSLNTPDIVNASRRIKKTEFKHCQKNNVNDITEIEIGYDGIAIAQSINNHDMDLTKKQLFLAVSAKVPSKDGKILIKNPYKKWNEINSMLPNRKIIIYGPPKSSGTRDAFEEMVLINEAKKIKLYKKSYKKYKDIRTDGIYIPSGENDNLIVLKLNKNKKAFGIFGYSFLLENDDKVKGVAINGLLPDASTISSGKYSISRSLFVYTKNSHIQKIPAIKKYIELFVSDIMIGEDSILQELGLISLPKSKIKQMRVKIKNLSKLSINDLRH